MNIDYEKLLEKAKAVLQEGAIDWIEQEVVEDPEHNFGNMMLVVLLNHDDYEPYYLVGNPDHITDDDPIVLAEFVSSVIFMDWEKGIISDDPAIQLLNRLVKSEITCTDYACTLIEHPEYTKAICDYIEEKLSTDWMEINYDDVVDAINKNDADAAYESAIER